jgi:hypothetical protein
MIVDRCPRERDAALPRPSLSAPLPQAPCNFFVTALDMVLGHGKFRIMEYEFINEE